MEFTTKPIKDWLYNHELSKIEAAKKINISPQSLHQLLKAKNMTVSNLIKLLLLTNYEIRPEDCIKGCVKKLSTKE